MPKALSYFGAEVGEGNKNALVRLKSADEQLPAQRVLQKALGDGYIVALNLAPTTPDWLSDYGAQPMKLGLDLSGGVHFLLEVDVAAAIERRLEFYTTGIKRALREKRIRGRVSLDESSSIVAKFRTGELRDEAADAIADAYPELTRSKQESEKGIFTYDQD